MDQPAMGTPLFPRVSASAYRGDSTSYGALRGYRAEEMGQGHGGYGYGYVPGVCTPYVKFLHQVCLITTALVALSVVRRCRLLTQQVDPAC